MRFSFFLTEISQTILNEIKKKFWWESQEIIVTEDVFEIVGASQLGKKYFVTISIDEPELFFLCAYHDNPNLYLYQRFLLFIFEQHNVYCAKIPDFFTE
jgi:hypothetical protein